MKLKLRPRKNPPASAKPKPLRSELLEKRELLTAGRIAWEEVEQLDLSFAPDGVEIAGEANELHSFFNQQFADELWQDAILRAFQTWAVETNANVGLATEEGLHPFGTEGRRIGDERFGDIRIGARPLDDETMAVAVSQNTLVSGTWAGDVIFNSNAEFSNLDELFSLALHEAGHVFGLEHSENEDSPMHVHGISDVASLTDEDTSNIQALYGERQPDVFERIGDRDGHNDDSDHKTEIRNNSRGIDRPDGSAPVVLHADITSAPKQGEFDVDYYQLTPPSRRDGETISIQVRTAGLSLLAPTLTVMTGRDDQVVEELSVVSNRGGTIDVEIDSDQLRDGLSLKVWADSENQTSDDIPNANVMLVGAYTLTVTYNGVNEVDQADIDDLSGKRYRGLNQQDIRSFFESGNHRHFRDDHRSNDRQELAEEVTNSRISQELQSSKVVGSLSEAEDVDFYRFGSPGRGFSETTVAYFSVRSLDAGSLIPEIRVFTSERRFVDTEVLVNGNGELLVQLTDVSPGEKFVVAVGSSSEVTDFQQGNYELNLFYTKEPTILQTFAVGEVESETAATHRLYVAIPQLFHFTLNVDGDNARAGVLARLVDAKQQVVHEIVAPRGETRTNGTVLLVPGEYTLEVTPLVLDSDSAQTISFSLGGTEISDPFGIDPVFPDDADYECENIEGQFCFPSNDTGTTTAFDWDNLADEFTSLFLDTVEVSELLLAEWWEAYWGSDESSESPVSAPESYDTETDGTLNVSSQDGVLSNDSSSTTTAVLVVGSPRNGALEMAYDGSFAYTPNAGFVGIDSFQYVASDFRNVSETVTVSIAVGVDLAVGDLDDSGSSDAVDIDLLAAAIQSQAEPSFDLNSDGAVNLGDHQFMINNLLGTTYGDVNLDGIFDSNDLVLVFQAAAFETGVAAGWEQGDWNADGKFDSSDLVVAFQAGGYELDPTTPERSTLPLVNVTGQFNEDEKQDFEEDRN